MEGKRLNRTKTECWEKLDRLYSQFVFEYDEREAGRIFEIIMQEFGDARVTISFAYYKRKVRNRQIRNSFRGGNYEELAIHYCLTIQQIRNIVHSDED
ncbi:MAG TPA: Mor transcription activator family protein [Candidatus Scalindua sp.]|jgi:Mor family transcriptional regulator|nr:Mor transcription activator family protein [Candidatus Scalindua sp.]